MFSSALLRQSQTWVAEQLRCVAMSKNSVVNYHNDSDLVTSCLNGNEAAWKELVTRYARLVYSIPLRMGLSKDDADDVFQIVFGIVYRELHNLRNKTLLAAWMIRITHRESIRLNKRQSFSSAISDELTSSADGLAPETLETWERQHLVRQAISQLDGQGQKLLTALFLEPSAPSYKQIAQSLGIPEGSIGPLRARYFKKLESILVAMGVDLSF